MSKFINFTYFPDEIYDIIFSYLYGCQKQKKKKMLDELMTYHKVFKTFSNQYSIIYFTSKMIFVYSNVWKSPAIHFINIIEYPYQKKDIKIKILQKELKNKLYTHKVFKITRECNFITEKNMMKMCFIFSEIAYNEKLIIKSV